jgi:hypothetical protein
MGASGRRVEISADLLGHSSLDVDLVLRRVAPVTRPVDLALALKAFGLRLRDAHRLLDRLVADEAVAVRLGHADRATMVARLAELGLSAD